MADEERRNEQKKISNDNGNMIKNVTGVSKQIQWAPNGATKQNARHIVRQVTVLNQ